MMILPLADALQNCLQNLTSRIAGVDNEQMTGRAMAMGGMLGYGIGAIKEQFKTQKGENVNSKNTDNSGNNNSNGLNGFIGRIKNVVNPTANLSAENDYNGNVNPIRNVIQKEKAQTNSTSNISSKKTNSNTSNLSSTGSKAKSIATSVVKTGFNATKSYLQIGANMAEGNLTPKNSYQNNRKDNKNNLQNTEYSNTASKLINIESKGDEDEFKGKSKE